MPKGEQRVPLKATEFMYADNCGPFPVQVGGDRHMCIFVDDATGMVSYYRQPRLKCCTVDQPS